MGGRGVYEIPHHNFVVISAMIMKLDTGIKLDVFYKVVTKMFVTSLLLCNYDFMTIFSPPIGLNFSCS